MANKKKKMSPSQAASVRWDAPDPNKPKIEHKTGFARWYDHNGLKGIFGIVMIVGVLSIVLFIMYGLMTAL